MSEKRSGNRSQTDGYTVEVITRKRLYKKDLDHTNEVKKRNCFILKWLNEGSTNVGHKVVCILLNLQGLRS
ncbi:hypothetical protein WN51_11723 [Melipona quadrifasciata]|uniref:Uncharacterized protein n=1 Tax=Melipona quadrifasciata TaxID=166423 RepID=A0A0N0BHL4_9HYME|nr:hypothetical protein WN51_11723 [Melipona quadrifasciata]